MLRQMFAVLKLQAGLISERTKNALWRREIVDTFRVDGNTYLIVSQEPPDAWVRVAAGSGQTRAGARRLGHS
jgi:hypothetical protein